jgi:hypothetical protein
MEIAAMVYVLKAIDVNSTATTHPTNVTGRRLSRMRSTPTANAFLAADLYRGRVRVQAFTRVQAAALAGCTVASMKRALAASPAEREAVLAGKAKLHRLRANGETLSAHLLRSTPDEWRAAAQSVGVDVVWERMIDPLI